MKAIRVHRFGGIEELTLDDIARPSPGVGEVLVRVAAAGVGPWDAWIRAGRSALGQELPLTLGSDISGIVESVGPGASGLAPGDAVYGVTNGQFTGGYAEYAIASASMLAQKPTRLTHVEAASVPVVATTAWQMLFDHAHVVRGQRVLVHGAAGSVGAYALQLAKRAGAHVTATTSTRHLDFVAAMKPDAIVDVTSARFEDRAKDFDAVIDTVGGETLDRSFDVLVRGGILVSAVQQPDAAKAAERGVRAVFFIVQVTTEALSTLGALIDRGELEVHVGEVLPLAEARVAHEMLAGKPHEGGKIVLRVDGASAP